MKLISLNKMKEKKFQFGGNKCVITNLCRINNFIVLDKYIKYSEVHEALQSIKAALEQEFIQDLEGQGYDYLRDLTHEKMLAKCACTATRS